MATPKFVTKLPILMVLYSIGIGIDFRTVQVTGFTYSPRPAKPIPCRSFTPLKKNSNHFSPTTSYISPSQNGFRRHGRTNISVSKTDTEHKSDNNPVHIYKEYMKRLWDETSGEARRKISKDRARGSLKNVLETFKSEKCLDYMMEPTLDAMEARTEVVESCRKMLDAMDHVDGTTSVLHETRTPMNVEVEISSEEEKDVSLEHNTQREDVQNDIKLKLQDEKEAEIEKSSDSITSSVAVNKKKPRRSILFGASMGAVVAIWVFSGDYIFTGLFTLMTALGQLEYYRMIMNTGAYPARKISVVGACAMFVTALFAPSQHQVVLPTFATLAMLWFLTMRRQTSTISDIATTFTGMFYLGYIPSFWVRTRVLGAASQPTRLAPIVQPILDFIQRTVSTKYVPNFVPKSVISPISTGSIFIFWSWLCIAFSDVGGYFAGRNFGKTKLSRISPAAGATSPNKTVEGVIGGCTVSAILATLGAWVMKWPLWYVTGPFHGVMLALLGLVGDLTASMLKRDAGLKDFGDLIPEHGGIMDRVDSFIFTAPYSWLVCAYFIPWLQKALV